MTAKKHPRKKPAILIAEDDHFYANIYQVKLSKEGFAITVVSDGEQALEEVKKNTPSLILLDVVMPKIDGFEVLRRLKNDTTLSSIPVIVLTNLGKDEDRDLAKSLGADAYLVKASNSIHTVVDTVKSFV